MVALDAGSPFSTALTRHAGVRVPLICGAMYPCSNPELVAAASEAGALGIIQPLSLVYVHGHEFRTGLRLIKRLTTKPVGMNVIVEKSSRLYEDRMRRWLDVALEEGIRFFVTSLGNPRWVCERVHAVGGVVYHDVTNAKWAERGLAAGADGLIAVNARAGGHAGQRDAEALLAELLPFKVPVVCAGGIGNAEEFKAALALGYAGAQLGTRFIATDECRAHPDYKQAIVRAHAKDIVLTERISGVPVAVIRTPYIDAVGTRAGRLARLLLRGNRTKHWVRMAYSLQSLVRLKRASLRSISYKDYWQAGQSVETIAAIEPVAAIVARFAAAITPESRASGSARER